MTRPIDVRTQTDEEARVDLNAFKASRPEPTAQRIEIDELQLEPDAAGARS